MHARIIFAGTPQFAADHLLALMDSGKQIVAVFTQPDRPGKRGKQSLPSPVKEAAQSRDLPVFQPASLTADTIADLEALNPDLMIVVAYGHKLSPAILALPRHGCINVHASLLPRWRGAAPIQRAIQAGDSHTGVTIMRMDEGWDTGNMLLQKECVIEANDTAEALERRLSALGQAALIEVVNELARAPMAGVAQDDGTATYAAKLTKAEGAIEWSRSAEQLDRDIRAFVPAPIAFTWLDDMRVRIWQAEVLEEVDGAEEADETGGTATPGVIMRVDRDGMIVACGKGALRLLRIQVPVGKGRVISIRDILNARKDLFAAGGHFSAEPPV